MQVGMKGQILPPGVKHSEEADLRAKMLGIGGNRAQGLGGRLKQDIVEGGLVLKGDCSDFLRHGKNDVEVLSVEQFGLTVFQPLGASQRLAFWTTAVPARVIRDPLLATRIALLDMTAERRRSTARDCGHSGTLCLG